jgi:hypothetical protein
MGGKPFIPMGQAERDEWASNFAEQVNLHYTEYGLTVTEKSEIVTSKGRPGTLGRSGISRCDRIGDIRRF